MAPGVGLLEENGLEDLGANGGRQSQSFAINDAGDVVGMYWDQDWRAHAFIASPGGPMRDLGAIQPLISQPSTITNDGRFAASTLSGRAFRTEDCCRNSVRI